MEQVRAEERRELPVPEEAGKGERAELLLNDLRVDAALASQMSITSSVPRFVIPFSRISSGVESSIALRVKTSVSDISPKKRIVRYSPWPSRSNSTR